MEIHVCILAAGQSKRMKSKRSKVLHPVCGKPMILHVYQSLQQLSPKSCTVIVGYQRDQVIDALQEKQVEFVVQEEQLGTGHAVGEFLKHFPDLEGHLLVLNGDTPLLRSSTLQELVKMHVRKNAVVSLLTADYPSPVGYGRVIRTADGWMERIVEEADATEEQKSIQEVNAGIYVFSISELRQLIPHLKSENRQKEYYLPDIIELALRRKYIVLPWKARAEEVMGVNTQVELAAVEKLLRKRINEQWMMRGVTMRDPATTYIDADVQFGTDVVLYPNVVLEGNTMIGTEVIVYPNCRITDCYVESRCVIYENSSLDGAQLQEGVKIGPFARLRPGTHLSAGVRIGNFVELKKTQMGKESKANHLAYLGDATIGSKVNIGAGTITCNYDGEKKYPTVIEDDVFIGSDTQLIAPVKIGKGAYVAAGSSITQDVPAEALGIARGKQVNKEGWAKEKKRRKES